MEEKTGKNLKEKLLFVVNLFISLIFLGIAIFFVPFTWKLSLIWIGLAILFSPQMKQVLIQKLKFKSRKILLPKLLILLFCLIGSLVIIVNENEAQQKAKEAAKQAEIEAQFQAKKQAFLENKSSHISELNELFTQGKYADVIAKGEPNIKFDQEIQTIVENAKKAQQEQERKVKIAQTIEKAEQLMAEQKYEEAHKLASGFQDSPELQAIAEQTATLQREVEITETIAQVKQLMAEQKYEDAHKLASSFQDSSELQILSEEALKTHVKNEEERLLSLIETTPESNLSSHVNIYRRLTELLPEKQEYKKQLAVYENKVRQEQQKAEEEAQRKAKIERQFSSWDGSHRNVVAAVKKAMNDPKSFEHVETGYIDKGEYLFVKMVFRGKNAFGALVKNTVYAEVDLDGNVLTIEQGE